MLVTKSALPADLKKFQVKIDKTDITPAVLTAVVFQDIFSPTWTCTISMNDTNNAIMNVPIKPGSKIKIKVESELQSKMDGEKEFEFIVYGIADRQFQNALQQTYAIQGVSEDFIKNQSLRVKQSFKHKTGDAILKQIVEESLGGEVTESDEGKEKLCTIINNISPFTAAQQICKTTVANGKDPAADFVFFMRDKGKYVFRSVEKLFSEKEVATFKMRPAHVRDRAGNLEDDYCTCISNYHFEHYDAMSNISNGYYASKMVTFDFISKTWAEEVFKFGDDVSDDKEKKPWDFAEFEKEDASVTFIPQHPGLSDKGETVFDSAKEWFGSRMSSMMKLEQDKLIVQVPGGVKGWEMLGKTIKIDMPSQQDKSNEQLDKQFKGKYFVVAISHFFGKHAYFTNYELIKKRHEKKMQ